MKKTNKVYSVSDFRNANVTTLVSECLWCIDNIEVTAVGEYSGLPLFEVQLKRVMTAQASDIPDGMEDATLELEPNRTYYVREGRPLFNTLASIWEATEDADDVRDCILQKYHNKVFRGRVEKLSGVEYTYRTKRGTVIQRSKLELWYPSTIEEGAILDEFIFLCNRQVYLPKEEVNDPLAGIDPAIIAAIKAAK